jgi:NADH-quinone oxidoreductase subunit C
MTPREIHEKLRSRFGDAIGDWVEPEVGDERIDVAASALHEVCAALRDDEEFGFDYLRLISSVDRGDRFSSVYHLYSYALDHEVVLAASLERETPSVASVVDLWPSAEWHERESFDMMGIVYEGNPNMKRILLPEDWPGHPLRKGYAAPDEYHGVPNN